MDDNEPDDKDKKRSNRFSSVGFHLNNKDDDYGENDMPEDDEINEEKDNQLRTTGGMSQNLGIIHENPDEEVT